jgi:hypothetical protein
MYILVLKLKNYFCSGRGHVCLQGVSQLKIIFHIYKGHTRVGRKRTKTQGLVSVLQNEVQREVRGVK